MNYKVMMLQMVPSAATTEKARSVMWKASPAFRNESRKYTSLFQIINRGKSLIRLGRFDSPNRAWSPV